MKIESKILIYSMINNLVIAVTKILGGIFLNLGSLLADGMHTFSDFFTDIVCLLGAKVSKKKPTKSHPFGFGKVEYLTNLFVGIILLALGIFIIIHGFTQETVVPPLSILWLLLVAFILKIIAIYIMHKTGEKINSQLLITAVKESKADLYSSFAVSIVAVLLQFSNEVPVLKYADLVCSILIGSIVLKTAYDIVVANSLSLIGEVEEDKEKIDKVKEFILKEETVKNMKIDLIKYGAYYKLQLSIELDPKLSLLQVTKIENKIKRDIIRHRSLKIKYVTIFVTNKI